MAKAGMPRTVVIDIETAPLEVSAWGLFDQNIGLEMLGRDFSILSFSAYWLDTKKMIYVDTGGRGADKVRDDKELLGKLWKVLDEADIVVGHNIQAFDIARINARLLEHKYRPYSPIRVVDTLLAARKKFGFTSNKLAYLSTKLTKTKKREHPRFAGFKLWAACLRDEKAAWREMRLYNIDDTKSTAELFEVLRPWLDGTPNVAVYMDAEEKVCPKCGSSCIKRNGNAYTQSGRFQRWLCQDCGGSAREKQNQLTKSKRASLLGGG